MTTVSHVTPIEHAQDPKITSVDVVRKARAGRAPASAFRYGVETLLPGIRRSGGKGSRTSHTTKMSLYLELPSKDCWWPMARDHDATFCGCGSDGGGHPEIHATTPGAFALLAKHVADPKPRAAHGECCSGLAEKDHPPERSSRRTSETA